DTRHATATAWHTDKYRPAFKEDFAEYYLVDVNTGAKTMLLENQVMSAGGSPSASPTGRYLTYFKDNHFHVYDTRSGTHKNVTELIPHPVWNLRDDRPGIKGPFGFGGWLKGDAAFLVYDEYDVWRVSPDGSMPRKLTSGRDG